MTKCLEDYRGLLHDINGLAQGGIDYSIHVLGNTHGADVLLAVSNTIKDNSVKILELFDIIEFLPGIEEAIGKIMPRKETP